MGPNDRILKLMRAQGISQKALAEKIGVSEDVVNDWSRGRSATYNRRLPQIAEVLGTTTEYLLTGKEPAPLSATDLTEEDLHILRQIHDRPGMRVMFSLTSKATDEDVKKATEIIRAFLGAPESES